MAKLRTIPSHSKVRRCDLCNRTLPTEGYASEQVWCSRCISQHVMGTPCVACNGAIHHPPGTSVWLGFGSIMLEHMEEEARNDPNCATVKVDWDAPTVIQKELGFKDV